MREKIFKVIAELSILRSVKSQPQNTVTELTLTHNQPIFLSSKCWLLITSVAYVLVQSQTTLIREANTMK